jgi:hypothetical protein
MSGAYLSARARVCKACLENTDEFKQNGVKRRTALGCNQCTIKSREARREGTFKEAARAAGRKLRRSAGFS